VEVKTGELAATMENLEKHPPADGDQGAAGGIPERIEEIRALLNQIKL